MRPSLSNWTWSAETGQSGRGCLLGPIKHEAACRPLQPPGDSSLSQALSQSHTKASGLTAMLMLRSLSLRINQALKAAWPFGKPGRGCPTFWNPAPQ
ncbi:hypothetical protein AAFF_G00002620 [Aldrovandia affinis]|uniref:Uncharacterized protein n=1 Tax=Aldrovandia affinis TaxID=143900 RepID=A0AAD7TDJ2_9TELE|nr:hypothetical protein AAFF_G00002620 [Aldrovandia affinis]